MLTITFSPMSLRPSWVAEPMCGSSVTLPERARPISFSDTLGSCSNTSSPAPAISSASNMRISAFSSTTSPREVLTRIASGRRYLSRRADNRWKVAGVCGQLMEMKSIRASIWSSESQ